MKESLRTSFFFFLFFATFNSLVGQANGYVHANGLQIVDPAGNNLLFRSIGTGNWMVQEGYMMQSTDVALTQHSFRDRLNQIIGTDKTNQFYKTWLDNHLRKIDIDSMSHWGFNCIRPALHYNLFTLPIENEPISGENTWIESGFVRLDSLVKWCAVNKMYIIFDMHAAPGGQGKDQAISDYDPTKPSLWESELNKAKFVALWRKIAERYATNPWIAGYDLLNETNWTFSEANNAPMRALLLRTTNAIREVDPNHMIIIEGNWFANDFTGLTPKWDNNMAYSFHKYWASNDASSINWMTDFRSNNNCPVWLGEAGENSNRWFTDCIELMEKNNIGWSWWPVKKAGMNNVLMVKTNSDYTQLLNYWRGSASQPTVNNAFQAVMTFAENHKFENCSIRHDVIDAMIRQPHSTETKPFKYNTTDSTIYASDFDFGRAGYAYSDKVDADYHVTSGTYTTWNNGYAYRNDGVDIQTCTDAITNGYSVGWIESDEWMQYTISSATAQTYNLVLRYSSESQAAKVYVEVNGKRASKSITLNATGSWSTWRSAVIPNVIVPAGNIKVKLVFENGGLNLNYFQFKNPKTIASTSFEMLNASTDSWKDIVYVALNKKTSSLNGNPFSVYIDGKQATVLGSEILTSDSNKIRINIQEPILSIQTLTISNTIGNCLSGDQSITTFGSTAVDNLMTSTPTFPTKIEVENFNSNNGFTFETCTDTGGGQNSAYAAKDKYLDYCVWIPTAGQYNLNFRVSVNTSSASLLVLRDVNGTMTPIKVISFTNTGGWQNWQNQSISISLPAGKQIIRLLARTDGFNLNWIEFGLLSSVSEIQNHPFKIYPNPTSADCTLEFENNVEKMIQIYDTQGIRLFEQKCNQKSVALSTQKFKSGLYIIKVTEPNNSYCQKLQKL